MSFFTLSPNMSLPIATVGQEPGPDYAFDVNASMTLIDQHDHSQGKGVQITPDGLDINSALSFQDNSAIDMESVVFTAQTSNSTLQAIYVAPGGETPAIQDLFYNDSAGNTVQLTKNGTVNASIANLPGESYAAGTFYWKQGDGSTTPANFDIGSITIRPIVPATTFGVTVSAPTGIASAYDFVLPLLPSVPSFLQIDAAGIVTAAPPVSQLVPTNGGSQGLFLRQDSAGSPVWQTVAFTVQTKTANYNISEVDDVILVSGGVFTVTLPTAIGFAGKEFEIKKTDSSLTNIITINTTSSQTIDGSLTVTLNTLNEVYRLCSDGANWLVMDHKCNTPWVNSGTTIIHATTTNPTKGTIVQDNLWYRRVGDSAEIRIEFRQSAAGTSGTGNYLYGVPTGITIDTNKLTVFTSTAGSAPLSNYSAIGFGQALEGGNMCTLIATAYDISFVRLFGFDSLNQVDFVVAAGQFGMNQQMSYLITFTVPVSGWSA